MQFVRQPHGMRPLISAHCIHQRCAVEPVGQELPVVCDLSATLIGVGHRVAYIGNALAVPWVIHIVVGRLLLSFGLQGSAACDGQQHDAQDDSSHCL